MTIARLDGLTYAYPGSAAAALDGVTLEVAEGEFALLAGPSAGGKSTLLRIFNGLVPQFHGGRMTGTASVCGRDPARTAAREMALLAGMVFQEPEAQAVAETVEEELAFSMEQQAVPRGEMHRRLEGALAALHIDHLRHRRISTLSGGERQRTAIAAALVLEPRLLLLDEPTSQLDPAGANAMFQALSRLRERGDLTILVAEHRLERLLPAVDTVIGVSSGLVTCMQLREAAARLEAVPACCQLARKFGAGEMPLTVEEAQALLPALVAKTSPGTTAGDPLLEAAGVSIAYGEHVALRDVSLTLREGEVIALIGENGSGKTSLFRALSGLSRPFSGGVTFPAASFGTNPSVRDITAFAGMVPQDPAVALYRETVLDELAETLRNRGVGKPSSSALLAAAEAWGIAHLVDRNPRDISVGQQQRVAIASMLTHQPRVWLLDEPTRGADGRAKAWLAGRLRAHAAGGGAAVVATHDIESAAQFATRVIALADGELLFDLPAREAFAATGPCPTQVARLVPGAVTVDEVHRA